MLVNGFWDSGRQLLFSSDRGGVWNLFSCRLDTGELVQLTAQPPGQDLDPFGSLDLAHERYLTWCGADLVAIDLRRARQETVYRAPDGWDRGSVGCEAGGGGVWFALAQAAGLDRSWAYLTFRVVFASDRGGYADIYRVVLPDDLGALPLAAAHPVERFYWM